MKRGLAGQAFMAGMGELHRKLGFFYLVLAWGTYVNIRINRLITTSAGYPNIMTMSCVNKKTVRDICNMAQRTRIHEIEKSL